jgi:hypothetical protein
VEHIFAYDEDDDVSVGTSEIALGGLAQPPLEGRVTAVRNWNAAATASRNAVLFVIADDLLPPSGWDTSLRAVIGSLDPVRCPFVVKVCDTGGAADRLIRHPVVSRCYFDSHGLFFSGYDGIGADNDFTFAAHARGVVVDGRSIRLEHQHPTEGSAASDSHRKMAAMESAIPGKQLLAQRWPAYKRHMILTYADPGYTAACWREPGRVIRAGLARAGYLKGLTPRRVRAVARALLPGRSRPGTARNGRGGEQSIIEPGARP